MPKTYYHISDGREEGPFTGGEIRARAAAGLLTADHLLREDQSATTHRAGSVPGLFPQTSTVPTNTQQTGSRQQSSSTKRPASQKPPQQDESPLTSPVSILLQTLTASLLDILHADVQRKNVDQKTFEQKATLLLTQLQDAVQATETAANSSSQRRPTSTPPAGNSAGLGSTANAKSPAATAAVSGSAESKPGKAARTPSAGARQRMPAPSYSAPPQQQGTSPLKLGMAALAGASWGYLLSRPGGLLGGSQYHGGHPSETHIHYYGSDAQYASADTDGPYTSASLTDTPDSAPIDSGDSPEIMAVDTNNDGLMDTFYGDTNDDGAADIVGRDFDQDGNLDEIGLDTDGDGTFDQTFTADAGSDFYDEDSPDAVLDEDIEDDDMLDDVADNDADMDMDMDVDMDMDMDFDFG